MTNFDVSLAVNPMQLRKGDRLRFVGEDELLDRFYGEGGKEAYYEKYPAIYLDPDRERASILYELRPDDWQYRELAEHQYLTVVDIKETYNLMGEPRVAAVVAEGRSKLLLHYMEDLVKDQFLCLNYQVETL